MKKKSLFIVIEGLDGSGKTSVTRHLTHLLDIENHGRIKLTFEPHDPSCAGLFIRQVLMKKIRKFTPRLLALSFAANRLDHCDREINPWLDSQEGGVIICDRYYLSSLVYQSSEDFPFESVYKLNEKARKPDVIFFLNVSNRICYERMKNRNEDKELFEKNLGQTRQTFLKAISFLRDEKSENIIEIDASGEIEEVAESILNKIYEMDKSLIPKRPYLSTSMAPKPRITSLNDTIPMTLKETVDDMGIDRMIKTIKDKDKIIDIVEHTIDTFPFNTLGGLFLDHIKQKGITVKERLPWTELDAYELEYVMPGDLLLRGVAIIIQEKQRYDIIIKKAPSIPTLSDFMFVFSPGLSELVTKYFERDKLIYNADIVKEGISPATQTVTQKDLALSLWATAKSMNWELITKAKREETIIANKKKIEQLN